MQMRAIILIMMIAISFSRDYIREYKWKVGYYSQQNQHLRNKNKELSARLQQLENQYRSIYSNSTKNIKNPLNIMQLTVQSSDISFTNFTFSCQDQIVSINQQNNTILIEKSNKTLNNYVHCDKCSFQGLNQAVKVGVCYGGGFEGMQKLIIQFLQIIIAQAKKMKQSQRDI